MAAALQKFDSIGQERVNQAVRKAESATSAEILPVVSFSSGRYDRSEDIVGLWMAAISVSLVWLVFPNTQPEPGGWGHVEPVWHLAALLGAMLVGFIVGTCVGERVSWLRRLFTPRVQMQQEVFRRARELFFDQRVHHTMGRSGVLLYVSLFEHMAAVITDQTVIEKLGQGKIDKLCHELTQRLHEENLIDALCNTIILLGDELSPLLPRAEHDSNELPDALVVID
ncbi:MAG: hypothetical protein ACKVT0_11295 [Planctomycetaceae bacterium]